MIPVDPGIRWLIVVVLLVGLCWAAVAVEDWCHRRQRRTHRPSWAKWRRTRAAYRSARWRWHTFLLAHWGIR